MYIASSNGLGLYTINNHVKVSGCSFINNTAYYGGALCLGGYNHLEVSNLTFTENAALDSGGAIFADESNEMSLETCTFTNNKAMISDLAAGGAILLLQSNQVDEQT